MLRSYYVGYLSRRTAFLRRLFQTQKEDSPRRINQSDAKEKAHQRLISDGLFCVVTSVTA
jgi:hypothetical protein